MNEYKLVVDFNYAGLNISLVATSIKDTGDSLEIIDQDGNILKVNKNKQRVLIVYMLGIYIKSNIIKCLNINNQQSNVISYCFVDGYIKVCPNKDINSINIEDNDFIYIVNKKEN